MPDRLEERRERLLRIGHAQPLDVGAASAPARATTGPDALDELDVERPSRATGVMMSANITAASTPWRRTGCSVTSALSSGVRG